MKTMFSFDIAGLQHYWDDVMNHLAVDNDEYGMSKKELIDEYRIDERVYRYDFEAGHVELVQEPDDSKYAGAVRIVADGILIGYIPHSRAEEARNLIANDDAHGFMLSIEGGEFHEVREEEDDDRNEKYVMVTDEAFPVGYIYRYIGEDVPESNAVEIPAKTYPAAVYTFIFIMSIVLIVMSLLLLIVVPVAGILGIALGVFGIIYSRKKRPKK